MTKDTLALSDLLAAMTATIFLLKVFKMKDNCRNCSGGKSKISPMKKTSFIFSALPMRL